MILGFAHITQNADAYALLGTKCYGPIKNAREKWPLMEGRAKEHWLLLEQDELHQHIPLEVVVYDTGLVEQAGRLDVSKGGIVVHAQDASAEAQFFCDGLGFTFDQSGAIELASPVPHWKVRVRIEQVEPDEAVIDPPLDISGGGYVGYAALAFYSSDVEADRDRAIAAGGRTPTEPFTVKLDREMKIIMLRSPEGTIIELIQIIRPPRGEELEWAKREAQKLGLT